MPRFAMPTCPGPSCRGLLPKNSFWDRRHSSPERVPASGAPSPSPWAMPGPMWSSTTSAARTRPKPWRKRSVGRDREPWRCAQMSRMSLRSAPCLAPCSSSSAHEVIPWAGHVNYAASKGGVMLMMKSLAQEVAPYRIRVNSICPGAIRTPINMEAWDTPAAYSELMKLIPYKRIGEPEEIGRAAVWLASDYADYVHGISLFVDGGMTLYPGFETGG